MDKHKESINGWSNDKAYCEFAHWWDCNFWCGNNKIFGKKLPHERQCPMGTPNFNKCSLIKRKK